MHFGGVCTLLPSHFGNSTACTYIYFFYLFNLANLVTTGFIAKIVRYKSCICNSCSTVTSVHGICSPSVNIPEGAPEGIH